MSHARRCSRSGCGSAAVTTLTYVYAEQMAVVGPLATYAEPHAYDLCGPHSERLSAPRGWEVMRLATDYSPPPPTTDDLLALADAVREAARPPLRPSTGLGRPAHPGDPAGRSGLALLDDPAQTGSRRGHLRALRSEPGAPDDPDPSGPAAG